MAHTDSCKIQVLQLVKRHTDKKVSERKACEAVEIESDGIPAETIRRWCKESRVKTDPKPKSKPQEIQVPAAPKLTEAGGTRKGAGRKYSQTTRWKKVINDLAALIKYMSAHCEAGAKIPVEMQADFDNRVGTLNLYNDDF